MLFVETVGLPGITTAGHLAMVQPGQCCIFLLLSIRQELSQINVLLNRSRKDFTPPGETLDEVGDGHAMRFRYLGLNPPIAEALGLLIFNGLP